MDTKTNVVASAKPYSLAVLLCALGILPGHAAGSHGFVTGHPWLRAAAQDGTSKLAQTAAQDGTSKLAQTAAQDGTSKLAQTAAQDGTSKLAQTAAQDGTSKLAHTDTNSTSSAHFEDDLIGAGRPVGIDMRCKSADFGEPRCK
jgi:hypothetical protein